ncbi:FecR family protein [Thauera sp. SDU_THAU2]|uniref:FecR family protein n=1 Tax=Thauera sp. SDU_THAU2 TaxID=3136633 RepID=UPI003120074B
MAEREGHPGEWELETMASAGPAAKAASPSTSDAAGGTEDGFAPYREALRNHFPSREEIIAEARAHTHRRRTALRTGGGSALAIVLAAALLWADPAWQREEIRTALGEQMRHTLADGSVLMLNTDTVLTIEKRLRTRSFILQQGEAGFTVAAGWRPFIVQTGDIRVRDIGTAFTVRRLSNGARVAVLEGVVEVSQPGHAGLTLREGQSVFTSDRGAAAEQGAEPPSYLIDPIDPVAAGAWQQGWLLFDGTPLAEVVTEIARYRKQPIHITDPRTAQLRLSGAYDIQGIETFLDTLPRVLPVTVSRAADGSVSISSAKK